MDFINLNKKPALDNESIAKIKKELNGWIKIKDELKTRVDINEKIFCYF